jgi:hypothetical protein
MQTLQQLMREKFDLAYIFFSGPFRQVERSSYVNATCKIAESPIGNRAEVPHTTRVHSCSLPSSLSLAAPSLSLRSGLFSTSVPARILS